VAFYEIRFQIAHVHFPKTAFTTEGTENTEPEKSSNGEETAKKRAEREANGEERSGEEMAKTKHGKTWLTAGPL
jgi:hypothetical protein